MSDPREPKVFVIEKRCDEKGLRVSSFDRTLIAVIIGIVFFLIAMPFAFKLSNKATKFVGVRTIHSGGSPTLPGMFIHTIIFIIVVRFLMK
jgi:hypothetical protein